jgi:hypothetical protein
MFLDKFFPRFVADVIQGVTGKFSWTKDMDHVVPS